MQGCVSGGADGGVVAHYLIICHFERIFDNAADTERVVGIELDPIGGIGGMNSANAPLCWGGFGTEGHTTGAGASFYVNTEP